jgi:glycine cleavage system transcriptional repressor
MNKSVVLTGVGRDRVGIVAELTQVLYDLGCNLLDSSMTLLRGEFALIVMAELPEGVSVENLEQNLSFIEQQLGMKIHARALSEAEVHASEAPDAANPFIVSVYGADRPGIVAKVTRALAEQKINITDVQTQRTTGNNKIFVMILEVTAPGGISAASLKQNLGATAAELGIDISVQALDVVEL